MPNRLDPPHEALEQVRRAVARLTRVRVDRLALAMEEDTMVLTGSVGSWYQKQVAQESARRIEGVTRVRNDIQVVPR